MDRIDGTKVREFLGKYKYAALILLIGLVLMLLPDFSGKNMESHDSSLITQTEQKQDSETRLEEILSQIQGAGKVSVMLTTSKGAETIYQTDNETINGNDTGSIRVDTVIISEENRSENGLIRQVNPAVYQGAIVVCQGADNPSVKLAITEAVSKITGLGADRICVVKMK